MQPPEEYRAEYLKTAHAKNMARSLLHRAVKTGKVVKGCCEVCKATTNIDGHHEDYSKPLTVKWLCGQCHANVHHVRQGKEEMRLAMVDPLHRKACLRNSLNPEMAPFMSAWDRKIAFEAFKNAEIVFQHGRWLVV